MAKKTNQPKKGNVAKVPVVIQMEALECGAACLTMILAYYHKWIPLEQVRYDCGVSRDGSSLKNIYLASKSYGFDSNAYRMEPDVIKEKAEFPCIIHWNFNHFVVLDRWSEEKLGDERLISQDTINLILRNYHEKPVEVPEDIHNDNQLLEYALRPSGLMMRDVQLERGWRHDAFGPMLGFLKESKKAVALIPGEISGYIYLDPSTGKKVSVTKKTEALFSEDALCFYKPLPGKKLEIRDLLVYLKNCISKGDIILLLFTR